MFYRPPLFGSVHVFLCMLAYYVESHMRRWLKPLLFDDHDPGSRPGQTQSHR